MSYQPVLIAGAWRTVGTTKAFTAVNPMTRMPLPDVYPVSPWKEVEEALVAGATAAEALRDIAPEARARFLEVFADAIEARTEAIVSLGYLETGLRDRATAAIIGVAATTDQLRQAAAATRERLGATRRSIRGEGCDPCLDHLGDLWSSLGRTTSPLFNSVSGGDAAAALAAGNPIIAKANTGHPGTTKLLTEAAFGRLCRPQVCRRR